MYCPMLQRFVFLCHDQLVGWHFFVKPLDTSPYINRHCCPLCLQSATGAIVPRKADSHPGLHSTLNALGEASATSR